MSWSLRDYRHAQTEAEDAALPPPQCDDAAPLPTYMPELEQYAEGQMPVLSLWQRKQMHLQGLWTQGELDQWAQLMRRGIYEQ